MTSPVVGITMPVGTPPSSRVDNVSNTIQGNLRKHQSTSSLSMRIVYNIVKVVSFPGQYRSDSLRRPRLSLEMNDGICVACPLSCVSPDSDSYGHGHQMPMCQTCLTLAGLLVN